MRRRRLAGLTLGALAATPVIMTSLSTAAPTRQGFAVSAADLRFILKQINIAEYHAANTTAATGICGALIGPGPNQIHDRLTSYGLRTVDGTCNNLIAGQERFGATDQLFPRHAPTNFRAAEGSPAGFFGPGSPAGASTSYTQKKGSVFDSEPRTISNLIVDQSSSNPAAVAAAGYPVRTQGNPGLFVCKNEVQTISGTPGGPFTISFDGQTTAPLPANATAADVFGAFSALTSPTVPVQVSGGPLPAMFTITFAGAPADVPLMTTDDAGLTVATTSQGVVDTGGACVPQNQTLFIPNVTTDVGLSPPYNALFTTFGQFFDHGLDSVSKGGSGTVFVPLKADDPLIAGADHTFGTSDDLPASKRFMVLSRATNQPGPDGILGDDPATLLDESADDVQNGTNTDSPWVDLSQAYTSHASHQVFLREYATGVTGPQATGYLLRTADSGLPTWGLVKSEAEAKLGIRLVDRDVLNMPMVLADAYGNFIPGPARGMAQWVTATGLVEGDTTTPVAAPANVKRLNTAFLNDLSPTADPGPDPQTHAFPTPDANSTVGPHFPGPGSPAAGTYDDELLDAHFIAGDGRVNENIALTSVHQVFHSEHDRLVEDITNTLNLPENADLLAAYNAVAPNSADPAAKTFTVGERLFQASRFVTEMEYQHLVFEEFARKVQPAVRLFHVYHTDINPAIRAEFAHAVYRFGHSMLNETIPRLNADGTHNDISLLDAFLNPTEFKNGGTAGALSTHDATGALIMGLSDQTGNELDEFVSDTLRNNLLGLPLDLPTLNLTRARETGIPPLNVFRRQVYATSGDGQLMPYTSWADFGQNLKHPESLINFVAAYGTHPTLLSAHTLKAKRAAATLLVDPPMGAIPPADAAAFINGANGWTSNANGSTTTGLDSVDLWVGGLAERTNLNGGLLGSTFNFVFENQLSDLQDGDRLYYLLRTPGLSLRTQLEGNSFAELVERNSSAHTLKADPFGTADCKFQLANLDGTAAGFAAHGATVADDPNSPCDEAALLVRSPSGQIGYRLTNSVDPAGINAQGVYNGTPGVDRIKGGIDNDTILGGLGNDLLQGNDGDDSALGGEGNDIITDSSGADVPKGGPGNDAIDGGIGDDIVMGGAGNDFTIGGANDNETFAGAGNDFVRAGDGADAVFGDAGDDWIQGGTGQDLLQGDHSAPFFDDPGQTKPGNDIMVGQAGENDYDAEGGDDIMQAFSAIERNAGGGGFDWAAHQYNTVPANDDMTISLLGIPLNVGVNRDRWQETEADSGAAMDDHIMGDSVVPGAVGGGGFTGCDVLDQAGVARIDGLSAILPPAASWTRTLASVEANAATFTGKCPLVGPTVWGEGNILIGGAGSDTIEGRGGDDIIDGDRYLNVRISVRDHTTHVEIGSADLMEHQYLRDSSGNLTGPTLQESVFAGTVDPGDLVSTREILTPTTGLGTDTAVFREPRANYDIVTNLDGSTTVTHARPAAAKTTDGTDTLWNVEQLVFTDQTIPPPAVNLPATGAPAITGTPAVGVTLSATNGTIADVNGIASVTFAWQQEGAVDVWTQVATGSSFTPAAGQVGSRLRVVATVTDNLAGVTTLNSDPTGTVPFVNTPASGAPVITGTPQSGVALTVGNGTLADVDGILSVTFAWEQEGAVNVWTQVATGSSFTPGAAQVGHRLRVMATVTDNLAAVTARPSAPTLAVTAPVFVNTPATGTPTVSGVAQAGTLLTAGNGDVADVDGITSITFDWEQEGAANVWTQVATGGSFTPGQGQVGHRIRVVATVIDAVGGNSALASTPTLSVAGNVLVPVNILATGAPIVTTAGTGVFLGGTRPRVGVRLGTNISRIADGNGLTGVVFRYQWQQSANGVTWTNIAGARTSTFLPTAGLVNRRLRVHVFFVDQGGSSEQMNSVATRTVRV